MIKKFKLGNPIETYATVEDIMLTNSKPELLKTGEGQRTLSMKLGKSDIIYGMGESVRGINKRGFVYRSFCSDDPNHDEDKASLYGAHNFFIVDRGHEVNGFFIDTPAAVSFDMGFTDPGLIEITLDFPDAYVYEITGKDCGEVTARFRKLIGTPYIPPFWGFGLGQSRWSYENEDRVRSVVKGYREAGIPLDMVYLDIDYMEDYKDFTISEERFPEFENFVKEMKEEGIRLIPIIDAGVKIEPGYDVYEEGLAGGFFCRKEDGEELVSAVWPGKTHFPDFLNPGARRWFGLKYKTLLDKGIEGFWNDMNEPAIFYTEDKLKEVFDEIDEFKGKNIGINEYFAFQDLVKSVSNNMEDYRRFYHNYEGKTINHERVHNLYGANMTRAAADAFKELAPGKKILMFSRASYIGAHRYGGIWTGDNKSWWGHLLLNIQQLPGLNMSGFLYSGADTCGFGANCSRDLALRWFAVSLFTPLMRNHSAMGTRNQEAYVWGNPDDFKNLVELRYAIVPYIYSEFMKAVQNDGMLFTPLAWEYREDMRAREIEDELLVGESIMIAPVYKQNATGRYVYLPERMLFIRFRKYNDYDEMVLEAGDHYIEVGLNEVPVFVRPGKALPLAQPAMRVEDLDYETVKYISFGGEYNLIRPSEENV